MLMRMMKKIALLFCLSISTVFAHTGVHNEIYHPLSGVDHFLVVLMIGAIAGVVFIAMKNKK